MTASLRPCVVVVGVGASQGIGAAVCRRAAQEGLLVYVVGRTESKLKQVVAEITAQGGAAQAYTLDATNEQQVAALFAHMAKQQQQPVCVVHNVGSNMPSRFLATPLSFFNQMWQHTFLSAFVVGQAAVQALLPYQQGTLIFTGASASLRGKPLFAAFTNGKGSLRLYSQLLAQNYASQGIHVAHVVVDGMVDGDRINRFAFGLGRVLKLVMKGRQGGLKVDEIADTYWHIHQQPAGVWTQELDLRPFKEKF